MKFLDTPGKVIYGVVGRVPIKFTYGKNGFVEVDALNPVYPEKRRSLGYVSEMNRGEGYEVTHAEYVVAAQRLLDDAAGLERARLNRQQLATAQEMTREAERSRPGRKTC